MESLFALYVSQWDGCNLQARFISSPESPPLKDRLASSTRMHSSFGPQVSRSTASFRHEAIPLSSLIAHRLIPAQIERMTGMEPFQVAKATSTEGDGAESFRAREESQRSACSKGSQRESVRLKIVLYPLQHHTRSQARIES
jgi:hypothetical protein